MYTAEQSSWSTEFVERLVVRSQPKRLQAGLMLQLLWASSVWHRQANGYSVKLTLVITDSLTPTSPPPTSLKPSLKCYRCFSQKSNLASAAARRPRVTLHETVSSLQRRFLMRTLKLCRLHWPGSFCLHVLTVSVVVSSSLRSLVTLNYPQLHLHDVYVACYNPQRAMWILWATQNVLSTLQVQELHQPVLL